MIAEETELKKGKVFEDEAPVQLKEEKIKLDIGSSKIINQCFTDKEHTSLDDLSNDLEFPEGEVCDIDRKICKVTKDFTEIKIGDKTVKVSGKDEVIDKIKNRIVELTAVPAPEPVVVQAIEPVVEPVLAQPIIRSEVKSLGQIVSGLSSILSKKPITSAQNKIRIADREAMLKLAKCAGV